MYCRVFSRILFASAFLLFLAQIVHAQETCWTWRVENAWLSKDGDDPAQLAYESLIGGFSGPDHPNQSMSYPTCTIDGNPAVEWAWANCTATVRCGPPTCPDDRSSPVHQGVQWREIVDCGARFYLSRKPKTDQKCDGTCAGDPIAPATGAVLKTEPDIPTSGGALAFYRFYNSGSTQGVGSLGVGWTHSYSRRIVPQFMFADFDPPLAGASNSSLYLDRPTACSLGFGEIKAGVPEWQSASATYSGGSCKVIAPGGAVLTVLPIHSSTSRLPQPSPTPIAYDVVGDNGMAVRFQVGSSGLIAPPSIAARLQRTSSGFTLTDENDSVETYDAEGRLLSITTQAGVVQNFSYDTLSRLTTVTDSFGHTLTLEHDAANKLRKVTDSGVRTVEYGYDPFGRLTSLSNGDGTSRTYVYEDTVNWNSLTGVVDESGVRLSTWTYDSIGRATSTYEAGGAGAVSLAYNSDVSTTVTEPLGATHTYTFSRQGERSLLGSNSGPRCADCFTPAAKTYDVGGYLASSTDYNGSTTTFIYDDARGLETSRTEAFGTSLARTTSTTWHPTFRVPSQIVEPTRTTVFTYDSSGNALTRTVTDTSVTPNVSRTWTYTYDSYGRVLTEDGPRTDVSDLTAYTYYNCTTGAQCGRVHTITNALGQITTFNSYNAFGQPLIVTDANGVLTTFTYDTRRRLTSRQVGSETTTFSYWPTGLLKKVTLPDASFLLYTYDDAHRLTRVEDGESNRIEYTLDAGGNRTAENVFDPSNTLARARTRIFNSLGHLWKQVAAAGTSSVTTTFGYDNEGNQASVGAPLARNSSNQYDELNRLKQITDPGNGVTHFAYDANDNLTTVTDPKTNVTTYTYNGFGDITQTVSPDTGTTANTYDSGGNLATTTDARSKQGSYAYDALNRVTSITYPDRALSFTYDSGTNGKGRLTGAGDASHSLAWSYDSLGRVISKVQTVGGVTKTVGYGYSNGNLTSLVTPSGQTITYGYSNGRVSSVTLNGSTTVLSGVIRDPFGPITGWTWGNGTLAARVYDLDGNLTDLDSAGAYSYHYDNAFRITGIDDLTSSAKSWTYGYDSLDRLSAASTSAASTGFTYDANGNRLARTGSGAASYTVPSTNNRVTAISGTPSRTYGYDAAGNVTSYTGAVFSYTDFGRLRSVTVGATTTSYTVNALGERVKKSNATSTTLFVYDEAGHLLGEYDGSGALVQETLWLEDVPVATLRPNGGGGVNVYYVHTDHLNSPRSVSRPGDNVVVWRWESEPFGGDAANEDSDGDSVAFKYNLRFPGQYYDAESGLSYNYFRDYDPATGRYVESDPIGLQGGINTYGYVGGNPLSHSDPSGLAPPGRTQPGTGFPALGIPGPYDESWNRSRDAAAMAIEEAITGSSSSADDSAAAASASCPPNDPCSGLRKQLRAHEKKLQDYMNDPLKYDNAGILAGSAGMLTRMWDIYFGRIRNLMGQIEDFKKQLAECEAKHGK